jgi:hypothetical protein
VVVDLTVESRAKPEDIQVRPENFSAGAVTPTRVQGTVLGAYPGGFTIFELTGL